MPDTQTLDTPVFQRLFELFLSALRRRDGEELMQLAKETALLARNARAARILGEAPTADNSYSLGAIEALETLCTRASERHAGNARLEAAQLPGARHLLMELGRHEDGTSLTDLAKYLKDMSAATSLRLLLVLSREGLIEIEGYDLPLREHVFTRVRLTMQGHEIMDQLDPGWKHYGLLEGVPEHIDVAQALEGLSAQKTSLVEAQMLADLSV